MRGVRWLVEQPVSSLFWNHPSVQIALKVVQRHLSPRMVTWMGSFGHTLAKPVHLLGTVPQHLMLRYLKRNPGLPLVLEGGNMTLASGGLMQYSQFVEYASRVSLLHDTGSTFRSSDASW